MKRSIKKLIPQKIEECFIVGCPRSGTFLLMATLENCFDAATPVETHFIPLFKRYLWLWGDISHKANRARLLRAIFDFLDIWTPRMIVKGNLKTAWKYSLSSVQNQFDKLINESYDYSSLVKGMFDAYKSQYKKKLWIDKSAFYKHIDLNYITDLFPNAKVIHMVRDGRDCALSWQRVWSGPRSLDETARLWAEHVAEKSKWVKNNPDKACEIRYEDLTADPKAVLLKLSTFLGIKPKRLNPKLSENEYANVLGKLESHRLVSGPILYNKEHKYIKQMTKKQQSTFMYYAQKELEAFNYENKKILKKPNFIKYYVTYIQALWCVNSLRRFFKNHLPLLIWCSQLFRIPLPQIVNIYGKTRNWPIKKSKFTLLFKSKKLPNEV